MGARVQGLAAHRSDCGAGISAPSRIDGRVDRTDPHDAGHRRVDPDHRDGRALVLPQPQAAVVHAFAHDRQDVGGRRRRLVLEALVEPRRDVDIRLPEDRGGARKDATDAAIKDQR